MREVAVSVSLLVLSDLRASSNRLVMEEVEVVGETALDALAEVDTDMSVTLEVGDSLRFAVVVDKVDKLVKMGMVPE